MAFSPVRTRGTRKAEQQQEEEDGLCDDFMMVLRFSDLLWPESFAKVPYVTFVPRFSSHSFPISHFPRHPGKLTISKKEGSISAPLGCHDVDVKKWKRPSGRPLVRAGGRGVRGGRAFCAEHT